jgi:hypothetical protein
MQNGASHPTMAPTGAILSRGLAPKPHTTTTALGELRDVTCALLSRLYGVVSSAVHILPKPHSLARHAEEWQLPPLPRDLESRDLTIDDILLRAEMLWIHCKCLNGSDSSLPENVQAEVARIASQVEPSDAFKGFAQTLIVAASTHTTIAPRAETAIRDAIQSTETKYAWRRLRDEIQEIARELDFPQPTSLLHRTSV